jgi:phosphoserine phosphatase RsbU/P
MVASHFPTRATGRALIADDQPDVLAALRLLLKQEGLQTEAASSPAAVIEALEANNYDLVLMDLNCTRDTTSGREGLDLVSQIHALDSTLPVVVMTSWGTVDIAIEAMRRGVCDFIQKPWENKSVVEIVRAQIAAGRAQRQRLVSMRTREDEYLEAAEIQRQLLPREYPLIRDCELSVSWRPARAVSGDYFDFLQLSDRLIGLCVADVAGKGMPAALLMSNVQAAVKASAGPETSPAELCSQVNRLVRSNVTSNKYVTFFYGMLDIASRRLVYVNAGHNPPLVIHGNGSATRLEEGGTVIGVFTEAVFDQGEILLEPGDRLILYTDGITEAENATGEQFGEDRLVDLLASYRLLDAEGIKASVMRSVNRFCDGLFCDDATLLVLAFD